MSNSDKKISAIKATRRLVTGIDAGGKSYAEIDAKTPSYIDYGRAASSEIWVDDGEALADAEDRVGNTQNLAPPSGGSVCRVFVMRPEGQTSVKAEKAKLFQTGDAMEDSSIDGPRWHATPTLDYGFVIKGRIELLLEDGPHLLSPGDVIVQKGTRHAWRNPGPENCEIAFVLIDRETAIGAAKLK